VWCRHAGLVRHLNLHSLCGRGVTSVAGNKWRSTRTLRGTLHYKTFNTRTEAALFFDLLGSDGHNFPDEFEDAEQMAETLRDVRSLPMACKSAYATGSIATVQPASLVCSTIS